MVWYGIEQQGATWPPYLGKPLYSLQVMSAIPQLRQAILTALYRDTALSGDTALLGDPCCTTYGNVAGLFWHSVLQCWLDHGAPVTN